MHILISSLLLSAAMAYGASAPPAEKCEFDGARAGAAVRLIAGSNPAPYYFACQQHNLNADQSGCIKGSLAPGVVVTLSRQQAGWSCVSGWDWTSGWVESSRLQDLPTEPRPPLADWEGWWERGKPVKGEKNDRLLITRGKSPGSLHLSGRAYWYGLPGVVHFGSVNGEGLPVGNRLHILGDCVLDLMLTFNKGNPELQAHDNQRCGGMNVSFGGTWHKFTPQTLHEQVKRRGMQNSR